MSPFSVLLHRYYVARISGTKHITQVTLTSCVIQIKLVLKFTLRAIPNSNHLGFHTSTNSIYAPVSDIVIVQMHFCKPNTRLPLSSPIEKTMVYGHPHAPISNMRGISPNEHGFVMLREVAPEHNITTTLVQIRRTYT